MHVFKFYYLEDDILVIYNVKQSWSDPEVQAAMKMFHLELNNNAIIHLGKTNYYGVEDDYSLYFEMDKVDIIYYLTYILSED